MRREHLRPLRAAFRTERCPEFSAEPHTGLRIGLHAELRTGLRAGLRVIAFVALFVAAAMTQTPLSAHTTMQTSVTPHAAAPETPAAATQAAAQPRVDSARIEGVITLHRAEARGWMERHEGDMRRYAEQNRALESTECDLLMIGSSSINLWHTLGEDMAPMSVIRRSYGGSTIRDIIYNYNTVARGYRPRAVVLLVNNDITGDAAHDLTVGEAYDWFRVFGGMVRRDYPDVPLVVLSVTPAPVREAVRERQRRLNALLEEWAAVTPLVRYVDLTAPMYDAAGQLREEIFLPDRLHVNPSGYAEWTRILRPVLAEIVGGTNRDHIPLDVYVGDGVL